MAKGNDALAAKNKRTVLKNLEMLEQKMADIRKSITEETPMTLGHQNLLASLLTSMRANAGSW